VSPAEHPPLYEERFVWAWDLDQGRAVRIERDDAGPWRHRCRSGRPGEKYCRTAVVELLKLTAAGGAHGEVLR
jgi:hypothetical protein